jgi:hypothetical protein
VEVVMIIFVEISGTSNVDILEVVPLLAITPELVGRLVIVVDTRHRGQRVWLIRGVGFMGDGRWRWEMERETDRQTERTRLKRKGVIDLY